MGISAIKHQVKNANRVSVFVDGKYSFSLTLDQLLDSGIKKGDEVTQADVKKYLKLSDEGKQKQRALEWLMLRPHSEKEFRSYMYRKKVEPEFIDVWVEQFKQKKYLNDENFARWFAEQRLRKNKSTRAVVAELRSKGIKAQDIDNSLCDSQDSDTEAIKKLITKIGSRPRYQDKQKLIAYLAGRGFNYSDIKAVLENND